MYLLVFHYINLFINLSRLKEIIITHQHNHKNIDRYLLGIMLINSKFIFTIKRVLVLTHWYINTKHTEYI